MPEHDLLLGRKLKGYQITEVIGYGGMGVVYRAEHPLIGKKVAVKVLQKDYSQNPTLLSRFFLEARTVNDIHHHNVIDILDLDQTPEGDYFLIMEYLEGQTLSDLIEAEAPFKTKRVGHISLQICSALDAAHEKGIIHRDLKGENVFLSNHSNLDDFVKVLDFGIAKLMYSEANALKTKTGAIMGTPLCMSPEQASGAPIDEQTDIYALGMIMYHMAAGSPPFYDSNPFLMVAMHITTPAPLLRAKNPKADPKLEPVIARCLEKEKGKRYRTMREVAFDLAFATGLDADPYFKKKQPSTRSNPVIQVAEPPPKDPKQDFIETRDERPKKLSELITKEAPPKALTPRPLTPSAPKPPKLPTVVLPSPIQDAPDSQEVTAMTSAPKEVFIKDSQEVTSMNSLPEEASPLASQEVTSLRHIPQEDSGPTQPLDREALFAILGQKKSVSMTMPESSPHTVKISGFLPLEEPPDTQVAHAPEGLREPDDEPDIEPEVAPEPAPARPKPPPIPKKKLPSSEDHGNWELGATSAKSSETMQIDSVPPAAPGTRLVVLVTFLLVATLGILGVLIFLVK